jgi:hypothetical protein
MAGEAEAAVDQIPITSRWQWLAERHQDITASVAGALFNVHPYVSALQVYQEKSQPLQLSGEQSDAMERGLMLEPVAETMLRKKYPDWNIWRPETYLRDVKRRIGATPDLAATDPARPGWGVIQVKSVEPGIFKRSWHNSAGELEPPLWIAIQALVERELIGANWAAIAALVVGHGIQLHLVPVNPNPGVIQEFYRLAAELWQRIDNHVPPEPTSPEDAAVLQAMFAAPKGSTIDLRSNNELTTLADIDERLRGEIKEAETRRGIIKAQFLAALGNHEVGMLADGRLLIGKKIDRAGYVVKPTSYVTVTVKDPNS